MGIQLPELGIGDEARNEVTFDQIRKQGAVKSADAESAGEPEAAAEASSPEPAEEKKSSVGGAKLSPLDLIRKQGAAKR